jgi:hypothetical protein
MKEPIRSAMDLGLQTGSLGLDWAALVALLVVGAIYAAAPAMGYATYSRGVLLGSLWLLVLKMILGAMRIGLVYFLVTATHGSAADLGEPLYLVLGLLESGLFLVALLLFVTGLAALRRAGDIER